MRYVILIYTSENQIEPEDEMPKWFDYTERLRKSGAYVGGEALQPTSTATTVRGNGREILTLDGPFAETKEQLGGFYLIDCNDLDEALKWASQIPSVHRGSVEVRPVMTFEQP